MAAPRGQRLRKKLERFIVPALEKTDVSLGVGAYGEVVEMRMNGNSVAVKKIHAMFVGTDGWEDTLAKFEDECIRLSSIKHHSIVSFVGIYFEGNSDIPMLVMEYVPTCLRKYVEGKIPPNDIKTTILLDIAQGLQYLHGLDPPMIHRDLTTNNVLLTNDLHAKITDLGTSKLLNRKALETMTNVPGNESHMPPEARVLDAQRYTILSAAKAKKLDVFSFGNVVINLLTGEFPVAEIDWSGRRTELQRRKHLLDKIPQSREKDFIHRCLNNLPDNRPTTDEVVAFYKGTPAKENVPPAGDNDEVTFVNQPDFDVNCPICLELFEDAHQSTCCGGHVCGQCTSQLKNKKAQCPLCRKPNFDASPDQFFMRQLLSLQVQCHNSNKGCPWSGELRELKKHVDKACEKMFSKCEHCSLECAYQALSAHVLVCAEAAQPCPNRCSATGVKRKHLKRHLEQECVLRVVGSDTVPHAANQCVQVAPLAMTMTSYSQYVSTGNIWYSPPFYTHKNGYKVHLRVDANWYKRGYVSVLVCVLQGEHDNKLPWPLRAQVEVAFYNWKTKQPFSRKTLNLPGCTFCSVNRTNHPHAWGRGDLEFISHATVASNMEEYLEQDCLTFIVEKVSILKAPAIPKLPPWAGDNCFAVSPFRSMKEKNLIFYGSPMHTHRAGYKFCPRVDPNGFGAGKGTHASISCALMHGEHDDTLPWPMEADVVLEMLNWLENKSHKRHTVSLNRGASVKSTSRVPVSGIAESNFGAPTFAAHSTLSHNAAANTQFLNEGCLLFRVASTTPYLDRASAKKAPAWINKALYPCLTVAEFAKRKANGNSYFGLPFFSHQNGYMMQLQVYSAKGTNVGVYLYFMKGPNDDWLQWPFRGDIVIELVNWRSDNSHHGKLLSLSSRCTNTVCEKVTSGERGMCWGYESFISHDSLPFNAETGTEYLKDDCLHFRVKEVAVYSTQTLHKAPAWLGYSRPEPSSFQFTVNSYTKRKLLKSEYYSPTFYTHRGGYKMRLEVKLHEEGQYITVFARLLKGENDARLDWPLCADVVVELLNWRQDANHHSFDFGFHERMPSKYTGRVLEGDSAANCWGTDSFISRNSLPYNHSTNTEYLQGDCLCFRVKVVAYSTALANKKPRWLAPNTPACFTITDVAERIKSGNVYYSPPFLGSKYRMCIRVYCGGNGKAKGTHISMYACLLRGEDDDALEWPFCGDVVVEILNWRGDRDHYKKALSLDSPENESHARVIEDVLQPGGYGKAQFMPHSSLFNYLEDQCMCVRVRSVACYSTPLRSKTPAWQSGWNISLTGSRCLLEFTVTGFSSRLANGSECTSPPFYTHSRGYKMVLVVTPGETGKDSGHMSIYAYIMAGEYDASLKWPLNVDLNVEMVNWAANSFHISSKINFGKADNSYRERVPNGRSSIGWGQGKFCSHTKLFDTGRRHIQYVQDDCVRIRVRSALVRSRSGLF